MYTGVVRHTGRTASVDESHDGAVRDVDTPGLGLGPGDSVSSGANVRVRYVASATEGET